MVDIARILLQRGAEPNMKNTKGKTPLHVLLEQDFHDDDDVDSVLVVVRLLLDSGADVNALDEDYTTPLYLAFHQGRSEIGQIILHRTNAGTDWHQAQWHITLEGEYNLNEHRPVFHSFH